MLDYSDTGAFWLRNYESDTFKSDIEDVWQTIKPFYQQLHAYVRSKLRAFYGEDKVPKNQPIPAHLLGIHIFKKAFIQIIVRLKYQPLIRQHVGPRLG